MRNQIKTKMSKVFTQTKNMFDSDTWVAIGAALAILVTVFSVMVII